MKEEAEKITERRRAVQKRLSETAAMCEKIKNLKKDFDQIAIESNNQKRGYLLEKFLNELFVLYDLDPKSSFKITGEQIDGAFTFDNNDYLIEAKWQKEPVNASNLYAFAGKLSGKLKNTLDLYISINGFSSESLNVDGPGIKSMILMDGADLYTVLENRLELRELLYRKRRHASETGIIYLKVTKIL